jgi:hypothetical protein
VSDPQFITDLWEPAGGIRTGAGPAAPAGMATSYAMRALDSELSKLASTLEGGRNHQLNVSAYNLGQLVAAGHLDKIATWQALATTAHEIGLNAHETYATIMSAFRSATPRHVPELEKVPDVTVITPPETDAAEDADTLPGVRDRLPRLDWEALWADDEEEEWIVEPLLPARRLVALFSAPKVGKSLLLLEMAVAIARGEPVLGTTIDRPRIVLYVDFENDPRGDVRSRLVAMGRKPSELENLVYLSFPRLNYLDSKQGAAELLEACHEYGAEVVVIDTVSRAVGGDENENDTWLRFYRYTGLSLKQSGIASIRLDHTGKDPTKGMRGGSAKYGDVDAVWSMTAVTDNTFRLECTANRMPVSEKVLVLRRELLPHLRHEVEGGGVLAIAGARQQQLVGQLNEIYGDKTPPSLRDAYRKLKDRGHGARYENVRDAISVRELTFNRLPYEEEE